jgi:hypothetical protein
MGWTIGVLGFDSRRGLGIFLFTTTSRTALGPTQPPIQWVPGALSLGVKRLGREAEHSPHLEPRSKNEWSYISTLQYAFMAWCSAKAQGLLYLYLYLYPLSGSQTRSGRCGEEKNRKWNSGRPARSLVTIETGLFQFPVMPSVICAHPARRAMSILCTVTYF